MNERLRRRVRTALLSIDGVMESPGIFSDDDAFWVNGRQIAHFREEDALELRLTKSVIQAQRARLKSDPCIELRPTSSDWVKVRFGAGADLPRVLELAKQSAAAHRPAPGVAAKPPPVGPDLERRRRFH